MIFGENAGHGVERGCILVLRTAVVTRDSTAVLLFPNASGGPPVGRDDRQVLRVFRRAPEHEIFTILFPGRTPDDVEQAVASLRGVGRVGPDEHGVTGLLTFARSTGVDPLDVALIRVGAQEWDLELPVADLAAALGLAVEDLRTPVEDPAAPADQRTILVARAADREYRPIGPEALGSAIEVREVDGWDIASWVAPEGGDVDYELAASQLAGRLAQLGESPGIVISTERFHTLVYEVDRTGIVSGRHWPLHVWRPVYDPAIRDVESAWDLASAIVDDLLPQDADHGFQRWGDDPVARRSAFRRTRPDLDEIAAVLGLPGEAVRVLRGESQLPARRFEATLLTDIVETELGLKRGSWRDGASLAGSAAGIAIAIVVVFGLGRDAVSGFVWWLWVVLGVTSTLHLVIRAGWVVARRREQTRVRRTKASSGVDGVSVQAG